MDLGGIYPAGGNHAIQNVAFVFEWATHLTESNISAVKNAHRTHLQAEFPEGATATVPLSSTKIDALRTEINGYAYLKDGWGGEGSRAPDPDIVANAISIASRLPAGIAVPESMISSSGEVGIYWNSEHGYVDIMFEEEGLLSVYTRDKAGGCR